MSNKLYVGKNPLHSHTGPIQGSLVTLEGEPFYQIANFDRLRPFFLSVVSSSDLWLFVSSSGGLTAGRGNPDQALFPYYTDDKLHDASETTGSKTVLLVQMGGRSFLWEPFSSRYPGMYQVHRNLYKNALGNQLIFEELNKDLGISFGYGWFNSEQFGIVRKAWLSVLHDSEVVRVQMLDGLQNIMPSGIGSQFQLEKSTLLDAYKRNELLPETGLGLFRLSSIPVDRPEPAESLRTTCVWSLGLGRCRRLLSSVQVECFRRGSEIRQETDVRAERGAYLLVTDRTLKPGHRLSWIIVADVGRGPSEVASMNSLLRRPAHLHSLLEADILKGSTELSQFIASCDGLQKTAIVLHDWRHSNNVLFNVMRGGLFADGYRIDSVDLRRFVTHANGEVAGRRKVFFEKLKSGIRYEDLVAQAAGTEDRQFERLCREYLPLTFSRRHGDPSRPWNRFSIVTRAPDGSRVLNYEGNWRDIFQNWEALDLSHPSYGPGMISRFVSASTADGYNPYRLTRDGIDWEVVDPSNPWSHAGYWGDHQIIYLLKLLEILRRHQPAALTELLSRDVFAYANVPYRIKAYAELLKNPKETVVFDNALEALVQKRVRKLGADGKLVWDGRNQVLLVNLCEKMLVSLLAKFSNFIPDAGIWLNTQRPEWNDANNALVGNGVSMVTLYYLRRYLAFCLEVFEPLADANFNVSTEVLTWLKEVARTLQKFRNLLNKPVSDTARKKVLDALGEAGGLYRQTLYKQGLSGDRIAVPGTELVTFFRVGLEWADHATAINRRSDALYHSYNLVQFDRPKELPVRRLYEMLEGQVAVLSSGRLTAKESTEVLKALRKSSMYRADQHSYLLYPNRELPRFVDKNNIPRQDIERSQLLTVLVARGERTLVEKDVNGNYHFNGSLTNSRDVKSALNLLARSAYKKLVKRDSAVVLRLFEKLFDHESFTGRSGTFFAYEGLGSIYWHMVSKLLLAVQETCFRAVESGESASVLRRLKEAYYDIRAGIGDRKSPKEYGAFPADPYSHTPAHTGARQPGLTGQVKEDILCRFGELGVSVMDGRILFRPVLLRKAEFLTEPVSFNYYDVAGVARTLQLQSRSLAFTYCQVPIVYRLAGTNGLHIERANGTSQDSKHAALDFETSQSIFSRKGLVTCVRVSLASI